ncbi:hypothetical protein VP01_1383g2 [Puccinia sorghi]|uniref:Uncharacterized protein n=1 Tax=Puccinia sorghi TaxID=27349 RepID=A0A0L6VLI5_9BASI|nr:hypothetical protein VP01_1383g2 [Puccinia sorghi]
MTITKIDILHGVQEGMLATIDCEISRSIRWPSADQAVRNQALYYHGARDHVAEGLRCRDGEDASKQWTQQQRVEEDLVQRLCAPTHPGIFLVRPISAPRHPQSAPFPTSSHPACFLLPSPFTSIIYSLTFVLITAVTPKFAQAQLSKHKSDEDRLCKECAHLTMQKVEAVRVGEDYEACGGD